MFQFIRQYDWIIIAASLCLVAYGSILLYSAALDSYPDGIASLNHPAIRHIIFGAVGLVIILAVPYFDYRFFQQLAPILYIFGIILLLTVLFIGDQEFGSTRWISVAGIPVQPSEFAKTFTIIALAKFLSDRRERIHEFPVLFLSLVVTAIPMALVLAEPDMGTAIVFGIIWMFVIAAAGVPRKYLLSMITVILISLPLFAGVVIDEYQRERISLFFNPNQDPLGGGFNILQAEIGIGSGGLFGRGLTEGTQTQLNFLQTTTTDYIFSVLGEELGFVGAILLFSLFIILLFRAIRIFSITTDLFGKLIAIGVIVMILSQVFINVAVNVRLIPVTGLPLPFISQGGSSLLSIFFSLALLQAVGVHGKKKEKMYSFRSD